MKILRTPKDFSRTPGGTGSRFIISNEIYINVNNLTTLLYAQINHKRKEFPSLNNIWPNKVDKSKHTAKEYVNIKSAPYQAQL